MSTTETTLDRLRNDVRSFVDAPGNNIHVLAKAAGVDWAVIKRFLSHPLAGVSFATAEKLNKVLHQKPDSAA